MKYYKIMVLIGAICTAISAFCAAILGDTPRTIFSCTLMFMFWQEVRGDEDKQC